MKPFSILLHLFIMLSISHSLHAAPKKPDPCGNVVTVSGTVTVKAKPLTPGTPIFPGEEVLTGENSAVKFLMVDKSIIDLGPSTSFKFEDYRDGENESRQAELALDYGTVRASVTKKLDSKSKFHIRTKSSVLAVRGTEFLAKWETKEGKVIEQVTVGSGRVEMNTGGRTLALNPGNQYNATGNFEKKETSTGAATTTEGTQGAKTTEEKPALKGEVTTLAPEKVSETMNAAKVEDKTFAETVTFEKRETKEAKKKEEKIQPEPEKEKSPKNETAKKDGNAETKEGKPENKAAVAEEKPAEKKNAATAAANDKPDKSTATAKTPEFKDAANGTLDSVYQGVTGERIDGKPIIIAKAPDTAATNPGSMPATAATAATKTGDRAPASEGEAAKVDPSASEGPKLPPSFNDPNRPSYVTPGMITGTGTSTPSATTTPAQTAQSINVTIQVGGL